MLSKTSSDSGHSGFNLKRAQALWLLYGLSERHLTNKNNTLVFCQFILGSIPEFQIQDRVLWIPPK